MDPSGGRAVEQSDPPKLTRIESSELNLTCILIDADETQISTPLNHDPVPNPTESSSHTRSVPKVESSDLCRISAVLMTDWQFRQYSEIEKDHVTKLVAQCVQSITTRDTLSVHDVSDHSLSPAEAVAERGDLFLKLNRFQEALDCYKEAQRLDSEDLMHIHKEAAVYLRLGKHIEYKKTCQRVSVRGDCQAEKHCVVGVQHRFHGEWEDALREFAEAIRWNPTCATYFRERAETYWVLGSYEAALVDIDYAIQLNAKKSEYWDLKGRCHFKLEEYEAAKAAFDKALQRRPREPSYLSNRCNAHIKLRRYDDAMRDAEILAQLEPDNGNHWRQKASVYIRMREYRSAVKAFVRGALRMTPPNSPKPRDATNVL
eukprot:Protomagalhaensia_wolfi_Nauph_80__1169@NODE_168_length_3351_cov_20_243056_g126_i0_p1_GENE_NODE_168_length_3351_cov_20_243056_g126_i0NODE_168_length_3351_cov_20_243056_g126_i0_p1_ORF_typecomplete_len373_score43_87TPR_15/PF13429_6/6_9e07TPR_15/PF13429_6/7_5e13TPR_15/PF13429_6/8_5e11TPR_16/PF13432_6/0_00033TPR_16/PF13432_6/6_5e05TPR_16/PF13432_6/2_3e08TPR_16/PF13432_6/6_3e06TPR_2/PF07719_17/8_2e05TPR_2/PF07719_17/0_27TPR_2/PF07719_17/21TPR_2/PF07719_17/8_9e07TPR_2/PF07719_17/0_0093TPR_2/PF07719_17/